MPRRKSSPSPDERDGRRKPITLKTVAQHIGLSPSTVSLVLNRSPVAESIPKETQDRVFAAARELNYRPNQLARSLRNRRSHTVGVLVPDVGDAYASGVLSGIESHLSREKYFYLLASHRGQGKRLQENFEILEDRRVEGFIVLASQIRSSPRLPTIAIAGHEELEGVTNVVIDHDHGIRQALEHLQQLGHEHIAFFKGPPKSSDTQDRWESIERVAGQLEIAVDPQLTLQLPANPPDAAYSEKAYRDGYAFGNELLARGKRFTTLFAFNDVSAIGAMRAILDAGLRVPEDISVVGFDDIQSAAFQNPSLTTVRQPLAEMGEIAARALLQKLEGAADIPSTFHVEPELVTRASTGPAAAESTVPGRAEPILHAATD